MLDSKIRKKEIAACNQYFYDGKDCTSDIRDALFDKIVEYGDQENFNISKIIYHCPESQWLEESMMLLNTDLKALKRYYNFNYKDFKNIDNIESSTETTENVLFIMSLIHTGKTFKEQYIKLKNFFPNSNIKAITILYSGGNNIEKIGNNLNIPIFEDETVSVNFLLQVTQIQSIINYQMSDVQRIENGCKR